ncbi:MAG: recombinase family protein, partial [Chloroflexi bacterium]|nr:recombinase family protein [Chloroflexota bacterium]
MLAAVEADEVDAIVAWHPDRLHRSPKELERFIDLVEATRTKVRTVTAGTYDLTTPSGRMQARIVGATARYESEHKSERLRSKHRELAQAGKVAGGGTRPFGYKPDRLRLDRGEAKLVREAVDRIVAGEPLRSVVRDWTARDVRTVTGRPWAPHTFRRMVSSARIAGWREHHGPADPHHRGQSHRL